MRGNPKISRVEQTTTLLTARAATLQQSHRDRKVILHARYQTAKRAMDLQKTRAPILANGGASWSIHHALHSRGEQNHTQNVRPEPRNTTVSPGYPHLLLLFPTSRFLPAERVGQV